MNDIRVEKITYLDTFPVRSAVLRQGKPIETCFFLGDNEEQTTHFGLFYGKKLVGVASVFSTANHIFKQNLQFQLRGMAVLSDYQGKGFGTIILKEICTFVETKKADVLWFNARENAVPFYQNLGFLTSGSAFEIPEIGTHFLMFKHFVV